MNRRKVIQSMGLITTHAMFPTLLSTFASCGKANREKEELQFFDENEWNTLLQILDVMIPGTDTPSASDVGTQYFLDEICTHCMTKEQQQLIHEGFQMFFNQKQPLEEMVKEGDRKAFDKDDEWAWFRVIKQYALIGFFTSEAGTTQASNYVKFPGDYVGEIALDENTLNYGKTSLRYYL
jgi:hypothetical protein